MVEIFGIKLFECSECNKRHSRKSRRRGYKGGYTYKHTGQNNSGEDVSNSPMASTRKRSRKSMSMSMMGGKRSKKRKCKKMRGGTGNAPSPNFASNASSIDVQMEAGNAA